MKFNRSAACVVASSALLLSACAVTPAQSSNEKPTIAPETMLAAGPAESKRAAAAFDYGDVAGTFTINVANRDGYTAKIEAVIHKPTLVSSAKEMPSWCPPHFASGSNRDAKLAEASSIISQTVEASVKLDDRPGFPGPSKWAPTVSTGLGGKVRDANGKDPYSDGGYGKCSMNSAGGAAPTLTSEGYQTVWSDIEFGRSTPAKPLPTKVEDVPMDADGYYFVVKDASKCEVQAAEGLTLKPGSTNSGCEFSLIPKAG